MKGKNKSCGSCMHYSRVSGFVNSSLARGSGLCELYDAGWARTDSGRNCPGFKRIKYAGRTERRRIKIQIEEEILKWR